MSERVDTVVTLRPSARAGRLRCGFVAAGLVSVGAVGVGALTEPFADAAGVTLTVTSIADAPDGAPGDGVCATGVGGPCTLRAAIDEANALAGADRIEFAIPGPGPHRIAPSTVLPIITGPVTIDGYSQPGTAPNTLEHGSNAAIRIELSGSAAVGLDGLDVRSTGSVITGLAIFDFRRAIRFDGPSAVANQLVGNFIGIDASGNPYNAVLDKAASGIEIGRGASDNRIGRPGRGDRNVISGSAGTGVALTGSGTDRNRISNNVIGLAPDGSDGVGNRKHGIDFNYNPSNNVVGGNSAAEGNVISGNGDSGVEISHDRNGSTSGNVVANNLIGTDLEGTAGPVFEQFAQFGVNLEGNESCLDTCPADISDNIVRDNVIVGHQANVMIWKGAHDNLVEANSIGVLGDGTAPDSARRTIWGVLIETGAFDNDVIGNEIAFNPNGVQVRPGNDYACPQIAPNCPEGDAEFPTFGNTLSRNVIRDNAPGLGIDNWPLGVNDTPSELDPNVQGGLATPVIVAADTNTVEVATCAQCLVEVFVSAATSSDFGQGVAFVQAGRADAAGRAVIAVRAYGDDPLAVEAGGLVSAVAIDPAGNTSEFSRRAVVDGGGALPDNPFARGDFAPATRCGVSC